MNISRGLQVSILTTIIGLFLFSQCSAEYSLATKKEEYVLFGTEKEVGIGRSIANKIEEEYDICKDPEVREKVEDIGRKLASVCDRKDTSYFFTVLEGEKVNAFALPGGYIYLFEGVIEKAESDDEIAGVLAHEIGHVVARHSMKRLQSSIGYSILSVLALVATKDPQFKRGTDIAFSQLMLGYSREDEFLADKLSVKYVKKAGFDPKAVVSFLEKLQQLEKEAPLQPIVENYARTHPYLPERIAAVKQEVYGKMEFTDYLNK
ncbi:MAG: M48 family metalloprotease [Candidatus Omnitrophica bacterium]|nr:M48 family metalloprotease [Candidatus Omnitrophota bacterium]